MLGHLLILFSAFLAYSAESHWGYNGRQGQENWCNVESTCCGPRQSPIALTTTTTYVPVSPLKFTNYKSTPKSVTMENNGHSVKIEFSKDVQPSISGGGLNGTYNFDSLHFHWGKQNNLGSEHIIDHKPAPMEVHVVHYNSKFASLGDAVSSGEGDALAVLGILYKVVFAINTSVNNIADQLLHVKFAGQTTPVKPFVLETLVPKSTKVFFRYLGSLTTPGCNEDVVWTVFKEQSTVNIGQLFRFRSLFSTSSDVRQAEELVDNFRYLQPLNGRTVYQAIENPSI